MNIIEFNLIFPIPFFLVYFTVTGNNHSLIGPNACNGNVKLNCKYVFFFYFIWCLMTYNCTRVFRLNWNRLKIVHVFFSHCIGSNHVNLRKYSLLLKQQCKKSFKIPKRKGMQCNGQREKDNHWSTKHYTENYHFPHSDIFFHRKQKSDFYFLNIKKESVISLQIVIIHFSLRTVGPD